MDIKEIVQLMERFDESKATKLQLKFGDSELVLESAPVQTVYTQPMDTGSVSQTLVSNAIVQQAASESIPVAASDSGKSREQSKGELPEIKGTPVKAPLVGTFYCVPSPEEKPFVSV